MIAAKIIFWVLLIDSVGAVFVSLFGQRWFMHHFQTISKLFPVTVGWAVWYLVLVVWIGLLSYGIV